MSCFDIFKKNSSHQNDRNLNNTNKLKINVAKPPNFIQTKCQPTEEPTFNVQILEDFYDDYTNLYKIVLIGNSGVGKSNYVSRISRNEFCLDSKSTIGVEFSKKVVKINNTTNCVQIWDTAGQERYRAITSAYYRGIHGAIIMYDVTNRKSFDDVINWYEELKNNSTNENVVIVLIGNKIDMGHKRTVSTEEGIELAKKLNFMFCEISLLANLSVKEVFERLTLNMYKSKRQS